MESELLKQRKSSAHLLVGSIFKMLHEEDQRMLTSKMLELRSQFVYAAVDQSRFDLLTEEHIVVGKDLWYQNLTEREKALMHWGC